MSCFQVSDYHINALVSWASNKVGMNLVGYYWAQRGSRKNIRGDEARVASVLFAENVRSVNARYQGVDDAHGFVYKREPSAFDLRPAEVLAALHCYEYQACEAEGWELSEAHAIVKGIERAAMRCLPGYEGAWHLSGPKVQA